MAAKRKSTRLKSVKARKVGSNEARSVRGGISVTKRTESASSGVLRATLTAVDEKKVKIT